MKRRRGHQLKYERFFNVHSLIQPDAKNIRRRQSESSCSVGKICICCYCVLLVVSRLYEQYLLQGMHGFPKHGEGKKHSWRTRMTEPMLAESCCWHRRADHGSAVTGQSRHSNHRGLGVEHRSRCPLPSSTHTWTNALNNSGQQRFLNRITREFCSLIMQPVHFAFIIKGLSKT